MTSQQDKHSKKCTGNGGTCVAASFYSNRGIERECVQCKHYGLVNVKRLCVCCTDKHNEENGGFPCQCSVAIVARNVRKKNQDNI